jgi:hypothetical protein
MYLQYMSKTGLKTPLENPWFASYNLQKIIFNVLRNKFTKKFFAFNFSMRSTKDKITTIIFNIIRVKKTWRLSPILSPGENKIFLFLFDCTGYKKKKLFDESGYFDVEIICLCVAFFFVLFYPTK